tara:strand:- start:120 stop:1286 length:1167 start_codon:yes stop_codon:yes gene_type:complete
MRNKETKSTLRMLAAKVEKWHGASPVIAFIDEVAHVGDDILAQAITGMSKRTDSIVISMTTPDPDRTRPYYSLRDVAVRDTLQGESEPQTWALCWNVDDDDPVSGDLEIVGKANPGLGVTNQLEAIQQNYRVMYENGNAEKRSAFVREHLCRFDDNISQFVDVGVWDGLQGEPALGQGDRVHVGIDLSRGGESGRTDICSICVMAIKAGTAHIKLRHFLPGEDILRLEKAKKLPFRDWESAGWLQLHQGKYIDAEALTAEVKQITEQFEVHSIGIDAWTFNAEIRSLWMEEYQWPIQYRGQPQHLTQGCCWFQDAVAAGKLCHNGDPILRRCLQNVVLRTSPGGSMRPCKNSTDDMIDGLVATLFAASLAADFSHERPSMYAAGDVAI